MDSIDDMKWILESAIENVRNIDAKNGILTAILAGLSAVLLSDGPFINSVENVLLGINESAVCLTFLLFLVASTMMTLLALLLSVVPRVKCDKESIIYAGKIAELDNHLEYKIELESQKDCAKEDLTYQIFINSKIYAVKAKWNKVATISVYAMILSIIAFAVSCAVKGC